MKTRKLTATRVILLALIVGFAAIPAVVQSEARTGPVDGRFIVKMNPSADRQAIEAKIDKSQLISARSLFRAAGVSKLSGAEFVADYFVVQHVNPGAKAADILNALGADNIVHIEPDYYLELFDFPTDDLFVQQWALHNTGQDYIGIQRAPGPFNDTQVLKSGQAGNDINISPSYESPPDDTVSVVVAIIDSGTDLKHPELQGRLWINDDEIPANGIDDDHNGYIDDTLGYDVSGDIESFEQFFPDNDPTDSVGHGTHVAGIVAANADGIGVVGVAPFVEIMSVKVLPNFYTSVGAEGIIYAVNSGAQIINISWGSPFESLLLQEALDFARANGVLVVVSAGNNGNDLAFYPAASDGAFTVGAGNSSGYVTSFSSYGNHLDLIAPGEDILSLRAAGTDLYSDIDEPGSRIVGDDSLYYLSDGTSMAAPVAAGAAALIWSFKPFISADRLIQVLHQGATDLIDPWGVGDELYGFDSISGFGWLDLQSSLDLLDEPSAYIISPLARSRHTQDLDVLIGATGAYAGSWTLSYSVGLGSDNWSELASGSAMPVDPVVYTFTSADSSGFVNLRLVDELGHDERVTFLNVRKRVLKMTAPNDGAELQYGVQFYGSAFGPDIDSLRIDYSIGGESISLFTSTAEFFDSLIFSWSLSGIDPGDYLIEMHG
ncbi:MAG: S8 family serine peptidase, partial [candidate division Zixibacteria bacterium]